MKKRLLTILFVACMMIFGIMGLTACDGNPTPATPQKLSAPVVTLTDNVATWGADSNADKFEISLDGNLSYVEIIVTSKTLTDGQSLKVRAVGDGISYSTSDWSNSVTYTATPAPADPVQLTAPVVTVSNTGLASWTAVANASSYVYKINNGAETPTTATSVQLTDGQSIVVKAVGDGTNHTDSDYSATQTYTAGTPVPQPTKLGTPTVTIPNTGLASWSEVVNASSYVYKINDGAETPTTATSVQLTDGQSIVVKAVGDGTNYTDSDYSASKTYTASTPKPTNAPTYLGILASAEEPSSGDVPSGIALLSLRAYSTRISLEEALRNYLSDSNNSLGDNAPAESSYEIYSSIGNTVYIQIWLDNPDQNTILSLKLNGTKYQSGGALQSFFIQDGDSYLNCVYVAVTIPTGSYNEIAYEVTEIEYVEGTNINQDGKSVLIDEDNDTVLIGLPYEQAMPTATISNENSTITSLSFDVNVVDEGDFVNSVGGWLRVVIYNTNNEIIAQQKLTNGNNTVTFNNLNADTYYEVMVFIFGDIHDGNGVYVHTLSNQSYRTESVLSVTVTSETLQNEQTAKYYPSISVEAELNDDSFTFTKVEVCDWSGKVYYTGAFDGSINITEGILNGQHYVVKVYYENASGVEQNHISYVDTESLEYVWAYGPSLEYGLIDDAILGFDFSEYKSNFENLTIKIIDEDSKQYIAEDAIALLDNPNLIDELNEQLDSLVSEGNYTEEEYHALSDIIYRLSNARTAIDNYYSSLTRADWEAELAKGIYSYVYVYGQDEEFFRAGNKYYVVLDGYQSKLVDNESMKFTLTADFDFNDGRAVEENVRICENWFRIEPDLDGSNWLFAEEFTIDSDNVVNLKVMSKSYYAETYRQFGYVNQVVLTKGGEIVKVLWSQEEPNHAIDESAWLAAIKNALISGQDVYSAFPLDDLQPITFDMDDIVLPANLAGNFNIRFTYKMYGATYTQDNPYEWDDDVVEYTIVKQLPQATTNINSELGKLFGSFEIVVPNQVEDGVWNYYTLEVKDGDDNLVGAYTQDDYVGSLSAGYSIRIRLDVDPTIDYYTTGEWSDWFVCERSKIPTPEWSGQSYDENGITVLWYGVDYAEKYVYIINNGEELETYETSVSGLKGGDTVKVKAVPATDSNYSESDYSAIYTATDTRTQLAAPANVRVESNYLMWDAVANAAYYEIEITQNKAVSIVTSYSVKYTATAGATYRVRACSYDYENYTTSEWSESFTYTVTLVKLDSPTFDEVIPESSGDSLVYWNRVANASGYNYKIGENGTVTSKKGLFVALSKIPAGEKLYVQACGDGVSYEDSDWVMIYYNDAT